MWGLGVVMLFQVLMKSGLLSHSGYIHDWGARWFPHSAL